MDWLFYWLREVFNSVDEFFSIVIPLAILLAILWGISILGRKGYRHVVAEIVGNSDGERVKLTYDQKQNLLNMIKILVGAQMIGLLFYVTPAINENIKIIASLAITLGAFVGTFFIKERKGYNGVCRTLILIGQEFFGITMFLMMVNKGMGYTVNTIFAIWTAFNFYISKQFGKIENRFFFWLTFVILIFSMIGTYANDMDAYILIIGICVLLLGIHFFGDKSKLSTKLVENITLTALMISVWAALANGADNQGIIFGTVIVYMIAIIVTLVATKRFNPKALFVYLPYVVVLFLIEWELDSLWFLSIFNVLFVIWLLADKSIYKKLLNALVLLCTVPIVIEGANMDELIAIIIYGSSIIFTCTYLFAPTRPDNLEEGGEENE